jgi:hypothetical protein
MKNKARNQKNKKPSSGIFLVGLLFDPEHRGCIFLSHNGLAPNYKALQLSHRCENLKLNTIQCDSDNTINYCMLHESKEFLNDSFANIREDSGEICQYRD